MGFKTPRTNPGFDPDEADHQAREQRETVYRHKVALQQFMNHNVPIFRAFANKGIKAQDMVQAEVLSTLVGNAIKLATLTASRIHGREPSEITAAEARPFRYHSAEWVAGHWVSGKKINIEEAALQIAEIAKLADKQWDHDQYKDGPSISPTASIAVTAANVAIVLLTNVKKYDFRLGVPHVSKILVETVITEAIEHAQQMLPSGATKAEVQNLTQTLSNNMASLMGACYDQKAFEVLKAIEGKPESFRVEYLHRVNAIDSIIANFKQWAACVTGMSILSAQRMTEVKPSSSPKIGG